jgi:hypothetical protein
VLRHCACYCEKKWAKTGKKPKKTGIFRRMQKLVNFIIQTSRVDVAGYGEQIHFSRISKKSKDSYFRPFCQNHELKNRLWGVDSFFPQLKKVKRVLFLDFSWKNHEFDTLTP